MSSTNAGCAPAHHDSEAAPNKALLPVWGFVRRRMAHAMRAPNGKAHEQDWPFGGRPAAAGPARGPAMPYGWCDQGVAQFNESLVLLPGALLCATERPYLRLGNSGKRFGLKSGARNHLGHPVCRNRTSNGKGACRKTASAFSQKIIGGTPRRWCTRTGPPPASAPAPGYQH